MNTLVRKMALNGKVLCVCFLSALPIARAAEAITISMTASQAQQIQVPMSPERFDTGASKTGSSAGAIQFGEFVGRSAVYLPSGLLTVKGTQFRDGALEAFASGRSERDTSGQLART